MIYLFYIFQILLGKINKYKLSVGPIIKYSKIEDNKYYFSFLYNSFNHELIDNELSFSFPMLFNDKPVESKCNLNQLENDINITIFCYFKLDKDYKENISYYNLKIGDDIDG